MQVQASVLALAFQRILMLVKSLPAMQETWIRSLGPEDPLEEGMATHSSTFVWRIPWTEETAWRATVYGVTEESDRTERLNTNNKRPLPRVLNPELLAMKPIDILRKSTQGLPKDLYGFSGL